MEWKVEIWEEEIRFSLESWNWIVEWKIEIWVVRRKKSDFDFEFSISWSKKVNLGSEKNKIRTQISIFHSNSTGVKSKSDFFFSNFVYSLQEMWFFQVFTPRNRKVKSKSDFFFCSEPNKSGFLLQKSKKLSRNQVFLF